MKKWFLLGGLLACFSWGHAEDIIVEPQGEYAEISISKELEAQAKLLSPDVSQEEKRSLVSTICSDMGSYAPVTYINVAVFYLSENKIEEAATFYARGIFRTVVDIRMSQDNSLNDVPTILGMRIGEALQTYHIDPEIFQKAFFSALRGVEEWDRNTPRNYDRRWASLHSIGAFTNRALDYLPEESRQTILEEEYARIREHLR